MELKTFVAETLKQIVDGVVLAQQDVKQKGATVAPNCFVHDGTLLEDMGGSGQRSVQMVDFDISLGETEGGEVGGRIGVFFGSAGIGAHGKSGSESSATNSVKFSVPLILPVAK